MYFSCRHINRVANAWIAFGILLLLLLSGCGARESGVSGKVTVDGVPLTSGTVVFYPQKNGAAAYGSIQSDGTYSIETGASGGLAAGEYVATVVATTKSEPGYQFGKLLTPIRYNKVETSDLKFSVKPGSNRIDLQLHSK